MHDTPLTLTLAVGVEHLPLLTTIAAGFAAAWALGLLTQRIGLSPIVGYLLAGVLIGPHTPGFVGDVDLAQQFAEIGVILLMFGVGLHFHLKDLLAVKNVAIPGAIGQSLFAAVVTVLVFSWLGWPLRAGAIMGMAMAVASTVVLLRILMDRGMLNTPHGHVAVGWLIVEDLLTVLVLVFIPLLADAPADAAAPGPATRVLVALARLVAMVVVLYFGGSLLVPRILNWVARQRSAELFTLTVLMLSVAIAVGSAVLFGASVALGAFLAGMVVAQSSVSYQAAADALPMRHAFAVLFFVSVGMLLDPAFILAQSLLVAAGLAVVLVAKPLAALVIVALCAYPVRTVLTVAIGLAQIGEFSFIVAQTALKHQLLPDSAMQVLVASAIVSITLNPLLFKSLDRIESALRASPRLWKLLSARHDRRAAALNTPTTHAPADDRPLAVIAGYGPVGRVVDAMLRDAKFNTAIVDMNIQTVQVLAAKGRSALYGDATRHDILAAAGIGHASYLVVTLPDQDGRIPVVAAARELNPSVEIIVRVRYLAEGDALRSAGASHLVFDEGEAGVALARHVLVRRAIAPEVIDRVLAAIRHTWKMDTPRSPAPLTPSSPASPPSPPPAAVP